jgi:hypothetical protein
LIESWHVLFVGLLCIHAGLFPYHTPWAIEANPLFEMSNPGSSHPSALSREVMAVTTCTGLRRFLGLDWAGGYTPEGAYVHIAHGISFEVDELLCQLFGHSRHEQRIFSDPSARDRMRQEAEVAKAIHKDMFNALILKLREHAYVALEPPTAE